ncbi:hypothetical protein HJC23_007911 [Cyclotella cryptica]|uniref:GP-PDE domain-containing protein n=1 Tax=Cyclotella cryptica TaxID=29204 RepID=A0ABD3NYM9_9STRA|eukprot:CCRYP_018770-RA/>CCRYP_018770-RA protein AED:0.32 eAED:0.32 QI:570/1/1/1/0.66/0.5/4/1268/410
MVSLMKFLSVITIINIHHFALAFLHPTSHPVINFPNPDLHHWQSTMLMLINPFNVPPHGEFRDDHNNRNHYQQLSSYSLASKLNVLHDSGVIEHTHPIEVVGHRGSLYTALENTSRSFLHAVEAGADSVELDVFLLKCGNLVVFHGSGGDERPGLLHLYCGIDGSILDYTAEEAKRTLTFNKSYDEFGCGPTQITHPDDLATESLGQEPIPHYCYVHTLEEVLTTLRDHPKVPPTLSIKIELKGEGTAFPAVQLVEKLNMMHRCHYSSFDHSRIAEVRELSPGALTGALFADDVPDDFIQRAIAVGASEIHLGMTHAHTRGYKPRTKAGLGTMAWFRGPVGMKEDATSKYHDVGNEDECMYEVVIRTGVRSMCVNRPGVLAKLAEKMQRRINWESAFYLNEEKKSEELSA